MEPITICPSECEYCTFYYRTKERLGHKCVYTNASALNSQSLKQSCKVEIIIIYEREN